MGWRLSYLGCAIFGHRWVRGSGWCQRVYCPARKPNDHPHYKGVPE